MIEELPIKDRETIVLSVFYFWLKFTRRNGLNPDFKMDISEKNAKEIQDSAIPPIALALNMERQLNADVSGSAQKAISEIILANPVRTALLSNLEDNDIHGIISEIDDMFENQEFCAMCESWSYYEETNPENFAISTTAAILWLTDWPAHINWFRQTSAYKDREKVVRLILSYTLEKSKKNLGQFKALLIE